MPIEAPIIRTRDLSAAPYAALQALNLLPTLGWKTAIKNIVPLGGATSPSAQPETRDVREPGLAGGTAGMPELAHRNEAGRGDGGGACQCGRRRAPGRRHAFYGVRRRRDTATMAKPEAR